MNPTTWTIKGLGAAIGALIVFFFPTPILITMLYCLAVMAAVDAITGVQAAIVNNVPVTVHSFIEKAGKKLTRGVSYLAMAWVAGQLIGSMLPKPGPVSEPIGFILGGLISADMLSVLRNLAKAKNNIPVLDRFLKGLLENLRSADQAQSPSTEPSKDTP